MESSVSSEPRPGSPAGWYRDPDAPDLKRYWDGEQWGEEPREARRPRKPKAKGKANRLAVTALICAAAIPFLLVGGILGAVFGFVALDEIEESEGEERGRGIAQAAIALGFLNIVLSCVVIAVLIDIAAG